MLSACARRNTVHHFCMTGLTFDIMDGQVDGSYRYCPDCTSGALAERVQELSVEQLTTVCGKIKAKYPSHKWINRAVASRRGEILGFATEEIKRIIDVDGMCVTGCKGPQPPRAPLRFLVSVFSHPPAPLGGRGPTLNERSISLRPNSYIFIPYSPKVKCYAFRAVNP